MDFVLKACVSKPSIPTPTPVPLLPKPQCKRPCLDPSIVVTFVSKHILFQLCSDLNKLQVGSGKSPKPVVAPPGDRSKN